jgi:hypothetical protein
MTREEETYFENFFELFTTEGWKQFQAELQAKGSLYDISKINSTEDLFYTKGELSVLNSVLGFESFIRQTYDNNKLDEVQEQN